ncbi:hypothetical protein SY83_11005 [Paenibacillus swuensis]|uniref:Lysine-N-methylase n=1 Tax=Paenibacillus swuensis TaxID=1178515 RepID=A0A172TIU8_9BACL|nr:flagellin lysine-N-methylase [Paenibacillus swuensis]ANE46713.1 hypothetical protein SY83_11005 [Paenibacillus swuensis]
MNKLANKLEASYMEQFSCTGGACEDTCCQGWKIYIDRPTYKKYKNIKDAELGPMLDEAVKRQKKDANDNRYAYIQLDEQGFCPLLTEEKLCSLHKQLGESYLSTVCSKYPKIWNSVDGTLEVSGVVSCPEIARGVLLNPNYLEFNAGIHSFEQFNKNMIANGINTTANHDSGNLTPLFWPLRTFAIQVLQNRSYSINDRLIMLGMFFFECSELVRDNRSDTIDELIANYTHVIDSGDLRETLSEIPTVSSIQVEFLRLLTEILIQNKSARYEQCFTEFKAGIGMDAAFDLDQITVKYESAYNDYYVPFFNEREYIYENYLVNFVFSKLFPFNEKDLYDSYLMMIIHYSLIKMNLIGMSGYHKRLDEELVIKLFQSFSRNFEHSQSSLTSLMKIVHSVGYTQMSQLMILIKN